MIQRKEVATWLRMHGRAAQDASDRVLVEVPKDGGGWRRLCLFGIAERVAYRAAACEIVPQSSWQSWPNAKYVGFLRSPLSGKRQVRVSADGQWLRGYVLRADIRDYYDSIPIEALVVRPNRHSSYGTVSYMLEILGGLQSNAGGIPQALEPSAWLAESYGAQIDIETKARGSRFERYNDDFAVRCSDTSEVRSALATLASVLSDHALTLNSAKTRVIQLDMYRRSLVQVEQLHGACMSSAPDTNCSGSQVRAVVDELQALIDGQAHCSWDAEMVRLCLQLDLKVLGDARRPDAVPLLSTLLRQWPSLTPTIIEYIRRVKLTPTDLGYSWRTLVTAVQTPWATAWWCYAGRRVEALMAVAEYMAWAGACMRAGDPLVRAEATVTLAAAGEVRPRLLPQLEEGEPGILAPWYAIARVMAEHRRTSRRPGGPSDASAAVGIRAVLMRAKRS